MKLPIHRLALGAMVTFASTGCFAPTTSHNSNEIAGRAPSSTPAASNSTDAQAVNSKDILQSPNNDSVSQPVGKAGAFGSILNAYSLANSNDVCTSGDGQNLIRWAQDLNANAPAGVHIAGYCNGQNRPSFAVRVDPGTFIPGGTLIVTSQSSWNFCSETIGEIARSITFDVTNPGDNQLYTPHFTCEPVSPPRHLSNGAIDDQNTFSVVRLTLDMPYNAHPIASTIQGYTVQTNDDIHSVNFGKTIVSFYGTFNATDVLDGCHGVVDQFGRPAGVDLDYVGASGDGTETQMNLEFPAALTSNRAGTYCTANTLNVFNW